MSKFCERFRQLKDEKNGLTLRELSNELDISVPNLSYYMKDREPNYDTLIKIADYFDVSVDWLIGRTDARTASDGSVIEMIENKIDKNCPKLKNKSREYYLQIQTIVLDMLKDVYIIYDVLGDTYGTLLHKQFPMMFLSFSRGINEYLYVLNSKSNISAKDKILRFVQNVELIAEVTHNVTLGNSFLCASCLLILFDIPENDLNTLKEILDFTITRFAEKFPDDKMKDSIKKLNSLHINE